MTGIYVYLDETGDLDFSGNPAAASVFGIGTATYVGTHGEALAEGLSLRCSLEAKGISLPRGFHAKNDSHTTRNEVFAVIARQAPRFDTTFLTKADAYPRVRGYTKVYLYKLAIFLHLKWVLPRVAGPDDRVFVILGSLQTAGKREAVREAVNDVCGQVSGLPLTWIVPCIWDAPSSWGIQVADYALWAVQRDMEKRESPWLESCIKPTLQSTFFPWR